MMVWTYGTQSVPAEMRGGVVAIGNFDGVHAGHRALLAEARALADVRSCALLVLTFDPHPRQVLRPDEDLKILTPLPEKLDLLAQAGVDGVAVLPFDRDVAGWTAEDFIRRVLLDWLDVAAVCVGENFRFGYKAMGDVALLQADGGFAVNVLPLVRDAGGVVSSSRLRSDNM